MHFTLCLGFSQYVPKNKPNQNILSPGKQQGLQSADRLATKVTFNPLVLPFSLKGSITCQRTDRQVRAAQTTVSHPGLSSSWTVS